MVAYMVQIVYSHGETVLLRSLSDICHRQNSPTNMMPVKETEILVASQFRAKP